MKRPGTVQWAIRVLASVAALVAAIPAYAQSCPMCYNAAASSKASAIQALRSGTLILIFPVLFIFAGIIFAIYRSRNRFYVVDADVLAGPPPSEAGDAAWANLLERNGLTTGQPSAPENTGREHRLP